MKRTLAAVILLACTACSAGGRAALPSAAALPSSLTPLRAMERVRETIPPGKIKHVVIVIQENRSFDNMFRGYPGADTVPSGVDSHHQTIELQPVSLSTQYIIDHSAEAMFAACDGTGSLPGTGCRMDGFDLEEAAGGPVNPEYVYVPHSESKPYWDMAHEWVLADRMFQSQLDESFVGHQYLIAGQAHDSVNLPESLWGCDGGSEDQVETITAQRTIGPSQETCFDYQTLGDLLDKAKRSWRFYTSTVEGASSDTGVWSAYQAVRHIRYGPDWTKDIVTPQSRFLTDVPKGKLANVTWITPTCANSDHPNCGGGHGPSWVASIVNTVGKSKFWDSTAIFVLWDDWGGLYDHVAPDYLGPDSTGFRVGLIVISPYAKKNYVSHVHYEHGSVLRFAEDAFGLPTLGEADARANSPAADCFDFKQSPRPFVPISAPSSPQFFLSQPPDLRPPDDE